MAAEDTVNLQNFPQQLATALGIPLLAGQILAGLIMMSLFVIPILFLTKGRNVLLALVVAYGSLGFATALTWFPAWMFILLLILTAALVAGKFREWLTGRF